MVHVSTFVVPEEALRPSACPDCGYPWQGLPEGRCPECGERVEVGELVLVGKPLHLRGASLTGEYWKKEITWIGIGIAICWAGAMLFVRPVHGSVWASSLVALVLFLMMSVPVIVFGQMRRKSGWPAGVLRLTSEGWRLGAGARKGVLRKWGKNVRLRIDAGLEGGMRLRAYRLVGGLVFLTYFDVSLACEPEVKHGVVERLEAWAGPRVERWLLGRE